MEMEGVGKTHQSGKLLVTTLPPPTVQPFPSVTPALMIAPPPTQV
jgi:hypothetical protein